jgi:hypothetical protein
VSSVHQYSLLCLTTSLDHFLFLSFSFADILFHTLSLRLLARSLVESNYTGQFHGEREGKIKGE